MTLKQDIQAEIARQQARLVLLNSIPEDTFPFKTIVIFQSASGAMWHYIKKGEELWEKMNYNSSIQKGLAEWIIEAKESNIGYFEVYALIAEETPFYASA